MVIGHPSLSSCSRRSNGRWPALWLAWAASGNRPVTVSVEGFLAGEDEGGNQRLAYLVDLLDLMVNLTGRPS